MFERKNTILYTILGVLFWGGAIATIVLIRPDGTQEIAFFLFLLFIALSLTSIVLVGNRRRGILISGGITVFLVLRLFSLDTLVNTLLFIGLLLTVEVYFLRSIDK